MHEFINTHLVHMIAALILIGRIGDITTTWLVSPTLKLEGNPLVRKLGWPFALATVLIFLVPYWDMQAGVLILVPSLLVSSSNAGKIWIARSIGEDRYARFIRGMVRRSTLYKALLPIGLSSFFLLLSGLSLMMISPSTEALSWWFALGIITYAVIVALYGSVSAVRLFRNVKSES